MTVIPESSTPTTWKGLCAEIPQAWDLDSGTLLQWLDARRACLDCPALNLCLQRRDEMYPGNGPHRDKNNPSSQIIAGVAYAESGRVLDDTGLRMFAAKQTARLRREQRAAAEVTGAAADHALAS